MSKNNQKVGDGKFVGYAYKLYNTADEALLFEAPVSAPDMMVYGVSRDVIPGLTAALKGLAAGDKFSVTLPPEAAFGEYLADNLIELAREIFMRDGQLATEVSLGAELPMMTQEGFMVRGRVKEIGTETIKMDFNHPFAGMTVKFDGEVTEVRDATPEELAPPQHGCGCGCSGGCGGGDCGDGCDCNHDHDCGCGCN